MSKSCRRTSPWNWGILETYKRTENKVVTVPDFQGKDTATEIITRSMSYYQTRIGAYPAIVHVAFLSYYTNCIHWGRHIGHSAD